jgi:tRNA uridine 5-carboxymethylaminomethyl modification enzyme
MAGINAALAVRGEPPIMLERSRAYLAVMIEDLVTKGVTEPYRLFTSRAEHRLLLRETNAVVRLSGDAFELGLIDRERWERVQEVSREIEGLKAYLERTTVTVPDDVPECAQGFSGARERMTLARLLKRPGVTVPLLRRRGLMPEAGRLADMEAEISIKYEGYIGRQEGEIERTRAVAVHGDTGRPRLFLGGRALERAEAEASDLDARDPRQAFHHRGHDARGPYRLRLAVRKARSDRGLARAY